jgi:hypothetical protein
VVAPPLVSMSAAHEGPPFPILMDKPLAGYVASVWADPDIGDARFFIIIESAQGGMPTETPQVSMWTEPVSGRLDRATYETTKSTLRNQLQFEATPHFDQRDMWTVGIRVSDVNGESHELTTEVESTPPGYGLWDLAIYLFPFFLLGGMWVIAMIRRRRAWELQVEQCTADEPNTEELPAERKSAASAMDKRS